MLNITIKYPSSHKGEKCKIALSISVYIILIIIIIIILSIKSSTIFGCFENIEVSTVF